MSPEDVERFNARLFEIQAEYEASERADAETNGPTAGEREWWRCCEHCLANDGPHPKDEHGDPCEWCYPESLDPEHLTPAEPDAGDVEALLLTAEALCRADESWEHHDATDDFPCLRCKALAVRLNPWLDAVRRKVGAEGWDEGYRAAMTASIGLQGQANAGASFPADAFDQNPYREETT